MADGRPNFLIILADDLGFSDVGCFGSEIKTPNIDSLAQDGVRFTDFHTASACSPTRSMLLSGTDHRVGTMIESIKDFQRDAPGYEGYLNDRVAALPDLLRDGGYHTMMSGKWHLGLKSDRWPVTRGFTRSYALLPGAANHYGWEPQLRSSPGMPRSLRNTYTFYAEDDQEIPVDKLGEDFYSTDRFTDKMLEYLETRTEEQKRKPFFGYLAYSAPHWPLQAPDEDIEPYKGRYDEGPDVLRQERLKKLKEIGLVPEHAIPHEVVAPAKNQLMSKQWAALNSSERAFSSRTMEAYAGMVQRMDKGIGRILSYLRSTNVLDNTVVMFLSDNGAEGHWLECVPVIRGGLNDHIALYYDNSLPNIGRRNSYVWYGPQWASAATAPGRLYKAFVAEGGIRVPLVVRYPSLTAGVGSGITHAFSTVMDIAPTLLELAGVKYPEKYKGRKVVPVKGVSWVPFLGGRGNGTVTQVHDDDKVIGWELFGRVAMRRGKWKALFIDKPWGPGEWELFNLEADPGETIDLSRESDEHKAILNELLAEWAKYREEVGVQGQGVQYGTLVLD